VDFASITKYAFKAAEFFETHFAKAIRMRTYVGEAVEDEP